MKMNVLSVALLAGMLSTPFAVANDSLKAPSVKAPQTAAPSVANPTTKAPEVKAPEVVKKEADATTQAGDKTAAATTVKIPEIGKLTKNHYSQAHVDVLVKNITARNPQPLGPDAKEMIRNNLVSQSLVVEEARRQGVTKRPEVKAQMELVSDNVVVGAFLADYFKHNPITEADAKKEYDVLAAQSSKQKEYQTRHILVEKEELAKQLIEQINKGESFEKLAKENSKDEGSKVKGGDLGWSVPQETFVKEFATAVLALEKGKVTQTPVKSQFGFHIIQLLDTRAAKAPEFDQVKAGLMERLKAKKLEQLIMSLRGKTK